MTGPAAPCGRFRIGIDLGGTKIEGVALGPGGATLAQERVPTPRGDYRATVETVRELVLRLERGLPAAATVGLGIPGALSPRTGLVKNANATWLIGRELPADLQAALQRPVRIDNDANCFAVSEAVDGAARGHHTVFGVILGTGVGGGIAIGGRPVGGRNAIAGEWGHNPLPWPDEDERPGDACYCGRRGCIETFLSGPALQLAYARQTGRTLAATAIAERAEAGDGIAGRLLRRYIDRLARSLAHIVNILDPDAIVLGGGLSRIRQLYAETPRRWGRHVFSDGIDTPLLPPRFGDASGVRGAAWLWPPAAAPGEGPG